jgi:hypothetical protein
MSGKVFIQICKPFPYERAIKKRQDGSQEGVYKKERPPGNRESKQIRGLSIERKI